MTARAYRLAVEAAGGPLRRAKRISRAEGYPKHQRFSCGAEMQPECRSCRALQCMTRELMVGCLGRFARPVDTEFDWCPARDQLRN